VQGKWTRLGRIGKIKRQKISRIPLNFPPESFLIIDFPADVSLAWKCAWRVDSAAFLDIF